MTLTEQMSVRLTEVQRKFVRERLEGLRKTPVGQKLSEADVVRAYIENARQNDLPVPLNETKTEI